MVTVHWYLFGRTGMAIPGRGTPIHRQAGRRAQDIDKTNTAVDEVGYVPFDRIDSVDGSLSKR